MAKHGASRSAFAKSLIDITQSRRQIDHIAGELWQTISPVPLVPTRQRHSILAASKPIF
jgi:hypothetical protein